MIGLERLVKDCVENWDEKKCRNERDWVIHAVSALFVNKIPKNSHTSYDYLSLLDLPYKDNQP